MLETSLCHLSQLQEMAFSSGRDEDGGFENNLVWQNFRNATAANVSNKRLVIMSTHNTVLEGTMVLEKIFFLRSFNNNVFWTTASENYFYN